MKEAVLITGGSKGIGFELSRRFAHDHNNIVLVARNASNLSTAAKALRKAFSIEVMTIPADLSDSRSPQRIFSMLQRQRISITELVNNAGFGLHGKFVTLGLQDQMCMMQVNMASLVAFTRLFLPEMIQRKNGGILNIASTAAFFPGPFMALYYATKTFVLNFSEALREELMHSGITISTLCPGPTKSHFHIRSQIDRTRLLKSKLFPMMSASVVAERGYTGYRRGRRVIIPGVLNKMSVAIAEILSLRMRAKLIKIVNTAVS